MKTVWTRANTAQAGRAENEWAPALEAVNTDVLSRMSTSRTWASPAFKIHTECPFLPWTCFFKASKALLTATSLPPDVLCTRTARGNGWTWVAHFRPCKRHTEVTRSLMPQTVKEGVTETQDLTLSRHSLGGGEVTMKIFWNTFIDKPLSPQANYKSSFWRLCSLVCSFRLYCIMNACWCNFISLLNDVPHIYAVSTSQQELMVPTSSFSLSHGARHTVGTE